MARFDIEALIRRNRLAALAAGGVAAFVGASYWSRRQTPAAAAPIYIQGAANELPPAQLAALLLQSQTAGAAAAAAGFEPGADVAIAGLGVAEGLGSAALGSLAGVAGTLAGSQAALGSAGINALVDLGAAVVGGIASAPAGGGGSSGGGGGSNGGGFGGGLLDLLDDILGGSRGGGGSITPALPPAQPPPVQSAPPPTTPPTGSGPTGNVATFARATTVYARTNAGYIGARETFGQAGLQVPVNQLVVPRDPERLTGGTFWRMTQGARTGWLISAHDPNVTVSPIGGGRLLAAANEQGGQVQVASLTAVPGNAGAGITSGSAGPAQSNTGAAHASVLERLFGAGLASQRGGANYIDQAAIPRLSPALGRDAAAAGIFGAPGSYQGVDYSGFSAVVGTSLPNGGIEYVAYRNGEVVGRTVGTGATDTVAFGRQFGIY